MNDENIYILNKKNENLTKLDDFELIFKEVKEKKYCGDIIWPIDIKSKFKNNFDIDNKINEIENQLKENNIKFSRFPNDYMHALLCDHITFNKYEDEISKKKETKNDENIFKENQIIELNNENWKILKIYDIYTGIIGEEAKRNINKVKINFSVLYLNEEKKQLVLVYKSIETNWKSLISENYQLVNTLTGIVQNKMVLQLYSFYEITNELNKKAKELNWI